MSSMGTKHDICSPFVPRRRNSLRKTCAEIVNESRQSLRVQSTQRPFTPQDGHRHLFGRNSVRTDSVSRPSSTFRSVMNSIVQYSYMKTDEVLMCSMCFNMSKMSKSNNLLILCSLHGQNFDASDSRPGSGTRLSPLNHVCSFTNA